MSRRPESVLVLITCADQTLLFERADWSGFWQSVTGSLEADESPAQAARRELLEETGMSAQPRDLKLCNRFEIAEHRRHLWQPGSTSNLEHVFGLEVDQAFTPRPCDEHNRWGWFGTSTARWLISSWTNRAALESVQGLTTGA